MHKISVNSWYNAQCYRSSNDFFFLFVEREDKKQQKVSNVVQCAETNLFLFLCSPIMTKSEKTLEYLNTFRPCLTLFIDIRPHGLPRTLKDRPCVVYDMCMCDLHHCALVFFIFHCVGQSEQRFVSSLASCRKKARERERESTG